MNLFKTLIHLNAFTSWSANAKRRSALSFSFNRSSCFSLTCNYAKHRAASYFLLIVPNPQCCDSLRKDPKGRESYLQIRLGANFIGVGDSVYLALVLYFFNCFKYVAVLFMHICHVVTEQRLRFRKRNVDEDLRCFTRAIGT